MDKEFHYYITYIVAQRAGFGPEDAYRIAYVSQLTDENTAVYRVNEGQEGEFETFASQTYDILNPQTALLRIHPVFHFMPGDRTDIMSPTAGRRDGKLHRLNTIPNGRNSRALLLAALETGNPCRIGIAAHTYSDAFAHQNFVGAADVFNSLVSLSPFHVGHVEAGHKPDHPAAVWHDRRLLSSHERVDNRHRCIQAAAYLLNFLSRGTSPATEMERLVRDLKGALGERDDDNMMGEERRGRYIQLINGFRDYSSEAWFDDAVTESCPGGWGTTADDGTPPAAAQWRWRPGYRQSDWYQFQCAVKEHQKYAMDRLLKPIFREMETVI